MDDRHLVIVYRAYLECLNARRWDDLGRFVTDDVVHNGSRLGLSGYREMLVADTGAVPDLRFVPELLIADDGVVACRLFFQCTPRKRFLGLEPTGSRVSFAEHVFYRFRDQRIAEVWSLIDKDAIRAQF